MEINRIELKQIDAAANEAAEIAIGELADLQLLAVGGGCFTPTFS